MKLNKLREIFRGHLFDQGPPTYSQKKYKELIKAHYFTLKKYLDNLSTWAEEYYINQPIKNKDQLKDVTRLINKQATIEDIYKIFIKYDLKDKFVDYLLRKTHFSFDLYGKPKNKTVDITKEEFINGLDDEKDNSNKFAEFIYLILAEYIILHNYMWAGGYKPKKIKSIDKWLKNI